MDFGKLRTPGSEKILTFLVLTAVVSTILTFSYGIHIERLMVNKWTPLVDAAAGIQIEAALGHLWLEEMLSDDPQVNVETVWKHHAAADGYARVMLEGGDQSGSTFLPLTDIRLRNEIERLRKALAEFRRMAKQRWETRASVGAVIEIDEKYDTMFRDFLKQADGVKSEIRSHIAKARNRFNWTLGVLAGLLALSYLGTGGFTFLHLSQRRRADARAQEACETLQTIVDALPGMIVALDLNYKIVLANRAAQQFALNCGFNADCSGAQCFKTFHHRNLPCGDKNGPCPFDEVVRTREPVTVEHAFRDEQGQEEVMEIHAVPVFDDAGELIQIVEIFFDISERKRAEEERLKLEMRVQQAQKLESLGVLAGGIAHDFNNLLVAILGNADLALMGLAPESTGREEVLEIKKAAIRASELSNQMLAYSGKGKFVVEAINLNRLIEEMGHLLRVSIPKKVVLRYDFAGNLPATEVDATQIRQVVMNLVTNAAEAIGEKSGVITVSTGIMDASRSYLAETYVDEDLPEGYYVFIEVSDTGCGMDSNTKYRIFDPFFTTKFTGRGLGMAAVLGIVRGHRGAIKVYSEANEGTTFKVLLPYSEKPSEPGGDAKKETPVVKDWKGSGLVLVIDDEESVRNIAALMLQQLGFSVMTAGDGRKGLDVFRENGDEIDLVLLDMTMPHMNGEETFRELRQLRPDIKVVLTSGYNEQEATHRFSGKGLAGFIQKPFSLDVLAAHIRKALEAAT